MVGGQPLDVRANVQRGDLPKVVKDADVVTYIVVCDPGDEAVAVGWFDPSARQFRRNPVNEQCELLSLIRDVAAGQDGPIVQMHATLGLADGTTRGGHFLGAGVPDPGGHGNRDPAHLRKVLRPEIGLALIDLDHPES